MSLLDFKDNDILLKNLKQKDQITDNGKEKIDYQNAFQNTEAYKNREAFIKRKNQ